MCKGFVLSESLENPTLLNNFRKIYVRVEEHPESPEMPFWHLFKIEIEDGKIAQVAERFAAAMKHGWYAHFWNDEDVYVCLPKKVFLIPREVQWTSERYQRVKQYGMELGVEERYLNFRIED